MQVQPCPLVGLIEMFSSIYQPECIAQAGKIELLKC